MAYGGWNDEVEPLKATQLVKEATKERAEVGSTQNECRQVGRVREHAARQELHLIVRQRQGLES